MGVSDRGHYDGKSQHAMWIGHRIAIVWPAIEYTFRVCVYTHTCMHKNIFITILLGNTCLVTC